MAKFLNKKEQAIDFQLTPYGKYKLSVGGLEPAYYSFFDNGVIYDSQYAGFKEEQNETHNRIKRSTSYLETITFFSEIEHTMFRDSSVSRPAVTSTEVGFALSWLLWQGEDDSGYGFSSGVLEALSERNITGVVQSDGTYSSWLDSSIGELIDMGAEFYTGESVEDHFTEHYSHLTSLDDDYYGMLYYSKKVAMFDFDINPTLNVPPPDAFHFDASIGDAHFEGEHTQAAPAWKAVTCQGEMINISEKDTRQYYTGTSVSPTGSAYSGKQLEIPQIDVEMTYKVVATSPESRIFAEEIATVVNSTPTFADGNVLRLEQNDLVLYLDEVNTELLTENFEIEVYEIDVPTYDDSGEASATGGYGYICSEDADCNSGFKCKASPSPGIKRCVDGPMIISRKYFEKKTPQIVDGMMKYSNPVEDFTTEIDNNAVEYYFEVLTDDGIDQKIGCQCANVYNKESYYVDIDFECEDETQPEYFDIYGSVTVPEICAVDDEEIYTEELCEDLEGIE